MISLSAVVKRNTNLIGFYIVPKNTKMCTLRCFKMWVECFLYCTRIPAWVSQAIIHKTPLIVIRVRVL